MNRLMLLLSLGLAFNAMATEEAIMLPDGTAMTYFIERPATNAPAPLAVVMGGGPGNRKMATGAMDKLGKPLTERGWVVVAPIAPQGTSFYNPAEKNQVRHLIRLLLNQPYTARDRILIGGLSNGGISALAIAQDAPQQFRGVIMTPGLPFTLKATSDLQGLPVYMRIGEKDRLNWGIHYDQAVKTLTRANAKLNAKLLKGEGHGFDLDWHDIDQWLAPR